LSRWRTAHIHVRRPSGVLLSSRVTSFAALDELRGFELRASRDEDGNGDGAENVFCDLCGDNYRSRNKVPDQQRPA
ncbi:hypothetical protein, partial [Lysobacter capsici]|uniref:hypothetical protein n=1 Tax=Lysobacter capsici TaxID=435897 RepID=UPI00398D116D